MSKSIFLGCLLGPTGRLCYTEYLLGVSCYLQWYLLNLSTTNSIGIIIILISDIRKWRLARGGGAISLRDYAVVTVESLYTVPACLALLSLCPSPSTLPVKLYMYAKCFLSSWVQGALKTCCSDLGNYRWLQKEPQRLVLGLSFVQAVPWYDKFTRFSAFNFLAKWKMQLQYSAKCCCWFKNN